MSIHLYQKFYLEKTQPFTVFKVYLIVFEIISASWLIFYTPFFSNFEIIFGWTTLILFNSADHFYSQKIILAKSVCAFSRLNCNNKIQTIAATIKINLTYEQSH